MSRADQAARVQPPREGGSIRLDVTLTAQRVEIPPALAGMDCKWQFHGDTAGNGRVMVEFGDSAVTVATNQLSTISTETIVIADGTGFGVYEENPVSWEMPTTIPSDSPTHFAFVGSVVGVLEVNRG